MAQRKRSSRGPALLERNGTEVVDRSGQRRRELVDAAAMVFAEKGYHATSVQDVAEALGILKGSIYYYIDSKEDLLQDIIRGRLDNIERVLHDLRTPTLGPLEKLRGFIRATVRYVSSDVIKWTVFVSDVHSLSGERHESAVKIMEKQHAFLRRQIAAGQKAGVICPEVDPTMTARGIVGMVVHTYRWRGVNGVAKPERLADEFADMILAGISCTAKEHRPGHRRALGALSTDW